MLETQEIEKYYSELQQDINALLISEEQGATPEQIFTEQALILLDEAGETENFRVCYDERTSRRGIEHKINGYALYENYETLDLFITIYNPGMTISTLQKSDIEKAVSRAIRFLENAKQKGYVDQVAESSEIFDIANTLAKSPDVQEYLSRVNIFILTNGEVRSNLVLKKSSPDYKLILRIIDIHYLYNLSDKSRIPIEIDFTEFGVPLPCITTNVELEGYQSYLAIIPGAILATIYERYGSRLLEQNVRSFLQFSGKINRGIRETIRMRPHMFLAFNNGIAATAEEVKFVPLDNSEGYAISHIKDFQIVNGGQTIAAIYHTWKKYRTNISEVYVQLKLTTIKDKESTGEIVAKIAEYANTQNRISASDLSSNNQSLVKLEMISRSIWAPPKDGQSSQTRWFFERARGQFKNERLRQGFTPSKRKAFDLKNPRKQVFTKELLAKYINCYQEIRRNNRAVIGPHIVVRGSQKNYAQFFTHNLYDEPDEIYFQDSIAKAILFQTAEFVYGIQPNSIGDLRYITVPYSIAWLSYKLENRLDLYKIWRDQKLDAIFEDVLRQTMIRVEDLIKDNAPGSLYGEWAKKEECWSFIRKEDFYIDLSKIKHYVTDPNEINGRSNIDVNQQTRARLLEEIESLGADNWKKIYLWCRDSGQISQFLTDMAHTVGRKTKDKITLSSREIYASHLLLEEIASKSSLLQSIYEDTEYEDTDD